MMGGMDGAAAMAGTAAPSAHAITAGRNNRSGLCILGNSTRQVFATRIKRRLTSKVQFPTKLEQSKSFCVIFSKKEPLLPLGFC
jgi:hypothetical protein